MKATGINVRDYLVTLIGGIEKYGWMIQGISGPPFYAYTVGLTQKGRRELVIVGLSVELSHVILNDAARHHVEEEIEPGSLLDIDWSVRFQVREVPARGLSVITAVYDGAMVPDTALQLVWPDQHGVYHEQDQVVPS
jgi:hypothetical protein